MVQTVSLQRIFGYLPSLTAAAISAALFIAVGVLLLVQVVRFKTWWAVALPIGAVGSGFGYIVRYLMTKSHPEKPFLIGQEILISCMPAFFLAFNYILYGRLLMHAIGKRHSLIRPAIISWVFIISDIVTFLVQAAGASFFVQQDQSKKDMGQKIFQVGIILQSLSYYVYVILTAWTHWHVKKERSTNGKEVWWTTYWTMYASSILIVIRTIYRLISSSDKSSQLNTNEAYMYGLDTVPLLLAIIVYIPWWPGKYIFRDSITGEDSYKMTQINSVPA